MPKTTLTSLAQTFGYVINDWIALVYTWYLSYRTWMFESTALSQKDWIYSIYVWIFILRGQWVSFTANPSPLEYQYYVMLSLRASRIGSMPGNKHSSISSDFTLLVQIPSMAALLSILLNSIKWVPFEYWNRCNRHDPITDLVGLVPNLKSILRYVLCSSGAKVSITTIVKHL